MSHSKAGIRTTLASFGAALAVVHVVFVALSGTTAAGLRTQRTDGVHVLTAPGNRRGGELAKVRALQIQRNATCHWLGIIFVKAGCRALQAFRGTVVARPQAGFFDLIKHFGSSKRHTFPVDKHRRLRMR